MSLIFIPPFFIDLLTSLLDTNKFARTTRSRIETPLLTSSFFIFVSGKFDRDDLPGDTSHFQALATALSGTVGTGNIAGVAFAIHLGGPAALFWMLVTAVLGMCTKFVEVSLSHKYRSKLDDGRTTYWVREVQK